MGDKVKSFFAALGYLLLSFGIQIVVSIVGFIGIGIYYAVSNLNSNGGNVDALTSDMEGMLDVALKATSWILLISSVVTILTLILIYKIKKRKFKEELQINKTKGINYLSALALGGFCWLFNSSVLSLVSNAGLLTDYFDTMENTLAPLMGGSILITIITVGIVAPIAEEVLFRGVVFNTLKKKFSPFWVILIQGVLFGVFHLNLIQGLYATLLGIIFGYVTYKTKSLIPAIIMHIVNNSMATIIDSVFGAYNPSNIMYVVLGIFATIAIMGLVFLISKNNPKVKEELPTDIQY